MSAAKKKDPDQPELPIDEAAKRAVAKSAGAPKPAATNGNGDHIIVEETPAIAHRPFDPAKIEQPLHRRVNTGFLEYASYVIRDRAIAALTTV